MRYLRLSIGQQRPCNYGVIVDNVGNTKCIKNSIYKAKNRDFPEVHHLYGTTTQEPRTPDEKYLYFYGCEVIVTIMRFGKISAILFGVTAATYVLLAVLQPG